MGGRLGAGLGQPVRGGTVRAAQPVWRATDTNRMPPLLARWRGPRGGTTVSRMWPGRTWQLDYATPAAVPRRTRRRVRAAVLSVALGLLTFPVCYGLYLLGIRLSVRYIPLLSAASLAATGGCFLTGLAAGVVACVSVARRDARLAEVWTAIAGVVLNAAGCVLVLVAMEWI